MAKVGKGTWVRELGAGTGVTSDEHPGYDKADLLSLFPSLQLGSFQITSAYDPRYNCVAWASGETDSVWQPPRALLTGEFAISATFWPRRAPAKWTVAAVAQVFSLQGYSEADVDVARAIEFERVAIFATSDDSPTHVAWSPAGATEWASKLGRNVDIIHANLRDIEGDEFGYVVKVLCRLPGSSAWASPRLET
jgi:hypothetical protein